MGVARAAVADVAAELRRTFAREQVREVETHTEEAWVARLLNSVATGVLRPMAAAAAASAVAMVEAATETREALEVSPGGRHRKQPAPAIGALAWVSQVLFDQNTRFLARKIPPTVLTTRSILARLSTLHNSFRCLLIPDYVFDMLSLGMSAVPISLDDEAPIVEQHTHR